jgi:hypothetical protein
VRLNPHMLLKGGEMKVKYNEFTFEDKQLALDQAWDFLVEKMEEREIEDMQLSLFDEEEK